MAETENESREVSFEASLENDDCRIDRVVTDWFSELSRSYIQKMIKEENVLVNGKAVKSNYRVREGDLIRCTILPVRSLKSFRRIFLLIFYMKMKNF